MSLLTFIPLYYQLLQAYHPQISSSLPPISEPLTPTPSPVLRPSPADSKVLGASTQALPAIGGDGQMVTIAVFGDSMIETLGPNLPKFASALQRYFSTSKFNLINFGFPATTIDIASSHLQDVIDQKPNIVIIESFAYNNFGNSQTGIDRQWQYLSTITSTIKQKLPQAKIVLAATIAPNSVVFGNGAKDIHFNSLDKVEKAKTIDLYLQNLVNFANSQNFPLADAYHPSLFGGDGFADFINPQDHIHTSEYGAEFFTDTLAKTIFDNKLID